MTCRPLCVVLLLLAGLALVPGCIVKEYPENLQYHFTPYTSKATEGGQEVQAIFDVPREVATRLQNELRPFFGTPLHPLVQTKEDIQNDPEMLLQPERLAQGSKLYRQHCLYCHGLAGDATGPTGQFLSPRPRDFRRGFFKFRSTPNDAQAPRREDLKRTIRAGIPSANMPSFLPVFSDDQLDALVSYVIHLTLRGKIERYIGAQIVEDQDFNIETEVDSEAERWRVDAKKPLPVPPPPEGGWANLHQQAEKTNWKRGKELFLGKGGCKECHGTDGRSSSLDTPTNEGRRDDWGFLNPPRDLTIGVYRGGSRPLDIFYRIKAGVTGSGMPSAATEVTDDDIWYIVDYTMTLPHRR